MKNDQGFADLIYEYFVVRFHFQYYKYGDSLPKLEALCSQFSVSSITIKSAFKRLQKEGYISRSHGRSARVLFQQTGKELNEYAVHFFSKRLKIISDLYRSTGLVVIPMLVKGLCLMDDDDFAHLNRLAQQQGPENQIRFYCYILQKTKNPLIMNLFWESTLYLGLPFPIHYKGYAIYDFEASQHLLKEMISAGRERNTARILEAHLAFQQETSIKITRYISERLPSVTEVKQSPFLWRVYRDRPQICCSLAIRVIHDVYLGDFRNMEFLPSYAKMAQMYDVSVSTIRRTIALLNQLGATQSINGKGTRVLMLKNAEPDTEQDLTPPAIRQNISYYIQSFELLAESCEGVMRIALQAFSDEEKKELVNLLEGYLHTEHYYISPQSIFAFVAEHSPLQVIQEIYGKLYGLNMWGYPLKIYRLRMSGLDQELLQFTKTVIRQIKNNETDRFAAAMGAFMKKEYKIAGDILLELGFSEEDFYLSPSFSLMQKDEV